MDKMILLVRYFGLADSLAFSTIPERCNEKGIKFYLSESTRQHFEPGGNPEVFDVIWKSNPFFCGFLDGKINGGNMYKSNKRRTESMIYQMERLHGFKPKNIYPKIYCKLGKIKELENTLVIDLNSYHLYKVYCSKKDALKKKVVELLEKTGIKDVRYVQLRKQLAKLNDVNEELLSGYKPLYIDSLFHYVDVLNSCSHFITTYSGASVLVSAIKQNGEKPFVNTIVPEGKFGSYYFLNINYCTI